jgi:hypothetical protein
MGLPKDSALMVLAAMDPSIRFFMADLRVGVLILKNNETLINRAGKVNQHEEKRKMTKKIKPKLGKVYKIN